MMRARSLLLASLLTTAVPALSQTLPIDLTVGYRFVSLSGSEEMYKSQINERDGFLVRGLSLYTQDLGSGKVIDSLRVDASDLGTGPAGSFRLEAGRSDIYNLKFSYRRTEHFSALPTFPYQTQDRTRNLFDVELTALPGKVISPIVGYTRTRYEGPATTTYTVGGDEFRLRSDRDDTEQEVRVGAAFDAGAVTGQVIQGWRKYESQETNTLLSGTGINPGTFFDVNPALTTLSRTTAFDANTPVTTASVAARFWRVKLIGSYVRANAEGDTGSDESLTGTSLVSYPLSRFFTGLTQSSSASSESKLWQGGGRIEMNVVDGVDLFAGFTRRHRELDGLALFNSLYSGTTNFAGRDPKDILLLLNTQTTLERTEDVFEVAAAARSLGPLSLRVGWSQADQDLTVTEDPAEIVVPGSQGGTFKRTVRRFDGAAALNQSGFTLAAEYRHDSADVAVTRTDFTGRDRVRVRAFYAPSDKLRIGLHVTALNLSNDGTGNDLFGRSREWGGTLDLSPWKGLRLHLGGTRFTSDSSLTIRLPQDFSLASSLHEERGTSLEGGLSWAFDPVTLDASVTRFENKGTYPFDLDRARVLLDFAVVKDISFVGEWSYDTYKEPAQGATSFDANRYGVFLRWHPGN